MGTAHLKPDVTEGILKYLESSEAVDETTKLSGKILLVQIFYSLI